MKLETPIKIKGNGTSLWGKSSGEYLVNRVEFNPPSGEPYELQLFGPNTIWEHYTDEQIEKEVNKNFLKIVQKQFPDSNVRKICWSEQGMQPAKGWSFDIID